MADIHPTHTKTRGYMYRGKLNFSLLVSVKTSPNQIAVLQLLQIHEWSNFGDTISTHSWLTTICLSITLQTATAQKLQLSSSLFLTTEISKKTNSNKYLKSVCWWTLERDWVHSCKLYQCRAIKILSHKLTSNQHEPVMTKQNNIGSSGHTARWCRSKYSFKRSTIIQTFQL